MSVEAWKALFDVLTVALLGLTFLAGAGVLITANIINRRQAETLRKFDVDLTAAKSDLAKQQERAAQAEASIVLAELHAAEANTKAEGFRLDIARSNEESAKAQEQVAVASADAAKATDRAAEANTKAEGFRLDITKAQAQVADATIKVAEATKATEVERIERLKLEAEIAPRRLTASQQSSIALLCFPFRGRNVTVVSYAMDPEGAVLAQQIVAALRKGGLKVSDSTSSMTVFGGFALGVHISGADQRFASSLRSSFTLVGQLVVAPEGAELPGQMSIGSGPIKPGSSGISILVGIKPITP